MKRLAWLLILLPSLAFAAKTPIVWRAPTTNTDGSPLTDLKDFRVEWDDCKGSLPSSATTSQLSYTVITNGFSKVCIRVYARNIAGVESLPSSTLVVNVTTLGKPQTFGQPVPLP